METLRVDSLVAVPPVETPASRPAPVPRQTQVQREDESRASGPDSAPAKERKTDPTEERAAARGTTTSGPDPEGDETALLREVAEDLEKELASVGKHSLKITYEEESSRFVVSVIDSESQEVIRQIPPEALLEARRQLDELRGLLFDDHS